MSAGPFPVGHVQMKLRGARRAENAQILTSGTIDPTTLSLLQRSEVGCSRVRFLEVLVFLGEDLLPLLLLAFSGAMVAGNIVALIRPPTHMVAEDDEIEKPPFGRSVLMAALGALGAIWAIATLVSG